jgi:hypothetical protein
MGRVPSLLPPAKPLTFPCPVHPLKGGPSFLTKMAVASGLTNSHTPPHKPLSPKNSSPGYS